MADASRCGWKHANGKCMCNEPCSYRVVRPEFDYSPSHDFPGGGCYLDIARCSRPNTLCAERYEVRDRCTNPAGVI